ncbi:MAG: ABC transporter ATP-binding protein [Promethearchaeota archaeon]|nr:MAG: ABC transporter ATP-binding protein [Candidatus Lokiarchaeota archaeon]
MAFLEISSLRLKYQNEYILDQFTLSVQKGELLVLLGESGCGKTSLLKILLGILQPEEGTITLERIPITNLPPQKRKMGYVPQAQVLFPHMTVKQNVYFGLDVHKEIDNPQDNYAKAIMLTQLTALEDRYPAELSGGQQQRVALARAIAIQPRILLLDEPLSSIDASGREELALTIRRIQQETQTTIIYVTHNHEEARLIADRIAVIFDGRVQQLGLTRAVYHSPVNYSVAQILGKENVWPILGVNNQQNQPLITTPVGNFPLSIRNLSASVGNLSVSVGNVDSFTAIGLPVQHYSLMKLDSSDKGPILSSSQANENLLCLRIICKIDALIEGNNDADKALLSIYPKFETSIKILRKKSEPLDCGALCYFLLTIPWEDFYLF